MGLAHFRPGRDVKVVFYEKENKVPTSGKKAKPFRGNFLLVVHYIAFIFGVTL